MNVSFAYIYAQCLPECLCGQRKHMVKYFLQKYSGQALDITD